LRIDVITDRATAKAQAKSTGLQQYLNQSAAFETINITTSSPTFTSYTSASTTMAQQSLVISAMDCSDVFCSVSERFFDKEWQYRSGLSDRAVKEEYQRYFEWADGSYVFHLLPLTRSLDHRARNHPEIVRHTQELFEDLKKALENIAAIASGQRPNCTAVEELDRNSEEGSEENNVENVISDTDANGRTRQISEAGESFGIVKCTITNLSRVCAILPKY
jgi:hypothetical protein